MLPAGVKIMKFTPGFHRPGRTGFYTLVLPSLSTKFIENSHQNFPVQPIFRDKGDMLFELLKSVEIVIILAKTAILP